MQNHPSRANDHLLSKMWKTKGSRFNAHARLRARHWASILATSLLLMYLAALSLRQLTFADALTANENKILSIGGVVVSIFLIIIILVETARNYMGTRKRCIRAPWQSQNSITASRRSPWTKRMRTD